MATKRKYYDGLIPFNLFGNQLHRSGWNSENWLESINFRGSQIWLAYQYHPTTEYKKIFFSDDQIKLVKFGQPTARPGYQNVSKSLYVGKCNSFVELPNYRFKDKLKYVGSSRGRSAVYFNFESLNDGRKYSCFLKELEDYFLMKMEKCIIEAEFTFCKRGSNFGLTIVE